MRGRKGEKGGGRERSRKDTHTEGRARARANGQAGRQARGSARALAHLLSRKYNGPAHFFLCFFSFFSFPVGRSCALGTTLPSRFLSMLLYALSPIYISFLLSSFPPFPFIFFRFLSFPFLLLRFVYVSRNDTITYFSPITSTTPFRSPLVSFDQYRYKKACETIDSTWLVNDLIYFVYLSIVLSRAFRERVSRISDGARPHVRRYARLAPTTATDSSLSPLISQSPPSSPPQRLPPQATTTGHADADDERASFKRSLY